MRNYIKDAEDLLDRAYQELDEVKESKDVSQMREIAEKGYGAASDVIDALTLRFLSKVCSSHNERQNCLFQVQDINSFIKNSSISADFSSVIQVLHTKCFHEADCNIPSLELGLNQARKVVESAKKVL